MKTNRDTLGHGAFRGSRHVAFTRARRSLTAALALCLFWALCANAEGFEPVRATVTEIDQFGDIVFDLGQADLDRVGLEYGDSVDLRFSGGCEMNAVPYYPDYYGKMDAAVLTVYFDDVMVGGVMCNLNQVAGVEPGEKVTMTLAQKGQYRAEFEAYDVNDATYRMEGQTDEAFLNAREVAFGGIRPGRLYRGSSPFDPDYGRVELMDSFIVAHDIGGILDLTDSREHLEEYEGLPDHTAAMIARGQVISCHLGVDYLEPAAMQSIGEGLAQLSALEGPWLVHCSLGRDRTGFVCALLEALCGTSYEEIVQDYMKSYEVLHSIDMNPDSLQYRLFKARIDEQLAAVFGMEMEALPEADLARGVDDYLIRCGMTAEQIDTLKRLLTAP